MKRYLVVEVSESLTPEEILELKDQINGLNGVEHVRKAISRTSRRKQRFGLPEEVIYEIESKERGDHG